MLKYGYLNYAKKIPKEQSEPSDRLFLHSPQFAPVIVTTVGHCDLEVKLSTVTGNEPRWSSQTGLVSKSMGVLKSWSPESLRL